MSSFNKKVSPADLFYLTIIKLMQIIIAGSKAMLISLLVSAADSLPWPLVWPLESVETLVSEPMLINPEFSLVCFLCSFSPKLLDFTDLLYL